MLPGFPGLRGAGAGQTESAVQQGLSLHPENDGPECGWVSCGFAGLQHTESPPAYEQPPAFAPRWDINQAWQQLSSTCTLGTDISHLCAGQLWRW